MHFFLGYLTADLDCSPRNPSTIGIFIMRVAVSPIHLLSQLNTQGWSMIQLLLSSCLSLSEVDNTLVFTHPSFQQTKSNLVWFFHLLLAKSNAKTVVVTPNVNFSCSN